jgi:hypothetical protein
MELCLEHKNISEKFIQYLRTTKKLSLLSMVINLFTYLLDYKVKLSVGVWGMDV